MAAFIYLLCAITAAACAVALLGSYTRSRHRVLFWSGLCFVALTLNNVLLVLDAVVFTDVDLTVWRATMALAAVCLLIYGLIFEEGRLQPSDARGAAHDLPGAPDGVCADPDRDCRQKLAAQARTEIVGTT